MTKATKRGKYQLGVVEGETREELGNNAVKHVGLSLSDPEMEKNIGKRAMYLKPEYPAQKGVFTISGVQKMWGHDETGKYVPDRKGYRVVKDENDFGRPALPEEIKILEG